MTVDEWLTLHCDGHGTAKKTQANDEEVYPDGLQGCDDTRRTAQGDRDSRSLSGAQLREELAPRVSRTERVSENGETPDLHMVTLQSHVSRGVPSGMHSASSGELAQPTERSAYLDGWWVSFKHLHDSHHTERQVAGGREQQRGREATDGDQYLHLGGHEGVGVGLGSLLHTHKCL